MLLALILQAATFQPFDARLGTISTTPFLISTGQVTLPSESSSVYQTPLVISTLPATVTGAGQAAGLYVDVSPWLTATPAAGDLVGAVVRVANVWHLQNVPGMWALNTLALHQGGAPPGGAAIWGIEVEVGHHETDPARIISDPFAGPGPYQLRPYGISVSLATDTPGPGTAAITADSAYTNPAAAKWRYGLAARGVSDAVIYDASGATDLIRVVRDGTTRWGLQAGPGAFRLYDYLGARTVWAMPSGPGNFRLWLDGSLRELLIGPPDSGGPGYRAVLVPN